MVFIQILAETLQMHVDIEDKVYKGSDTEKECDFSMCSAAMQNN